MIPAPVRATIEKGNLPELTELPDDLRPVPGRVFVRLDSVEECTPGGIVLTDKLRELGMDNSAWTGTVIRVPLGHDPEEDGFKEGDRVVLLLTYADVKHGGRTTTIVQKEMIMGVVEPGIEHEPPETMQSVVAANRHMFEAQRFTPRKKFSPLCVRCGLPVTHSIHLMTGD